MNSVNENTHNFKIEHDTAFKLEKHDKLFKHQKKNENLIIFFSINSPLNSLHPMLWYRRALLHTEHLLLNIQGLVQQHK